MACGAKGVYGRAKGTVRSKAEPWNERPANKSQPESKDKTIPQTALTAIGVDQFLELPEQILAVVWASGGFGVILNAEGRVFFMTQTSDGIVVQVNMSHF